MYDQNEIKSWLQKEIEFINTDMANTLNGRLKAALADINAEKQEITLSYPLEDWQVNGLGTLHGGISGAMMDLTMSIAVFAFSRETIPPTITMTTNYIRPVPMKGSVLVTARVNSIGKRNATAYSEVIIPESGKIACSGTGVYAIIKKQ